MVWDAEGSQVDPSILDQFYGDTLMEHDLTREQFVDEYVDQLVHLNRLVLQALDGLEAAAEAAGRSAVIIVMSDHGSGSGLTRIARTRGIRTSAPRISSQPPLPGTPGCFRMTSRRST